MIWRRTGGLFVPRRGVLSYGRPSTGGGGGGGGDTLGSFTRPSALTTGLTNAGALSARNTTYNTSANGETVQNLNFADGVDLNILHNNVTVQNCKFLNNTVGTGAEGTRRTGCVIQDCELVNTFQLGGGISVKRCYVHGQRNQDFSRNPSACTWESNYFTDFVVNNGISHMDVIQWFWSNQGQAITDASITVQGNFFDIDPTASVSGGTEYFNSILLQDQNMVNITWRYNWHKAGGYHIRLKTVDSTHAFDTNKFEDWHFGVVLTNNGVSISPAVWTNNQVLINGSYEAMEKPPGTNSDLWNTNG